jgi:protocatechuate 3,4-dioxygenase, alpha subunit
VTVPKPTPSQTVGPFFARDLLWKDGGIVLFPGGGERITLTGCVFDGNGAPIYDALFETWQADPSGKFSSGHDGARPYGYGRVSTDTEGRYAIETVKPGSFKGPGGETYAPQISVAIFARGLLKALHTRVFPAPLDLIKDDPLARAVGDLERLRTLVATPDPNDPKIYRWDVRLRGAGEAVFIEL